MNVLVVGATGGSGRAVVQELLERGHAVTAFTRRADAIPSAPGLRVVTGDAMNAADLERAVPGHDAVVITLGISENPLAVRLRGSSKTANDVRSRGTTNTIAAMQKHGVRRLVVQTTYGVGATAGRLPLKWRLIFALLLKPQIADTELQERAVRQSGAADARGDAGVGGLEWVLVQPVGLTDSADRESACVSMTGEAKVMHVSRKTVARVLADAVTRPEYTGQSLTVSAGDERRA